MSKYKRLYRKYQKFSDILEYRYQLKHKQTPRETYEELKNHGASHEDAFDLIQERMDDIWKEYRSEKQIEAQQAQFHDAKEVPFTDTEQDILNHLYRMQEEAPLPDIPPDYNMNCEQLELCFT